MDKNNERTLDALLEEFDELEHGCICAIWDAQNSPTYEETERIFVEGKYIFYSNMDLYDVALDILRDFYNIPCNLEAYFDFDLLTKDLENEGYVETFYGTILLE